MASDNSGVIENMDFHGFRRYIFGSFGNQANAIIILSSCIILPLQSAAYVVSFINVYLNMVQ